jgi:hypothetical protein
VVLNQNNLRIIKSTIKKVRPTQKRGGNMGSKTLNLIVPGVDAESPASHRSITIRQETTAGNILEQENLQGYQLSTGPDKPFLADADHIYDLVDDNGKLYATTRATQGNKVPR